MNNEDMYKKAMDNIHPSEDLVNKTINKVATQPTKEHKSLYVYILPHLHLNLLLNISTSQGNKYP